MLGLEKVIGLTVVDPVRDQRGWAFRDGPGFRQDPVNCFAFLAEAYRATDPASHGRVTVPILWDKVAGRIVNNSEDISRMLAAVFRPLGTRQVDLFPADIAAEQAELSQFIYERRRLPGRLRHPPGRL